MAMTNAQQVNAIEFLIGALRGFGMDKSAADDIASLAVDAITYATSVRLPDQFNPEMSNGHGEDHANRVQGQQRYPNLSALIDLTG